MPKRMMLDAVAGFSNTGYCTSLDVCLKPMTRVELQDLCGELSIGKRLPGACYFARETIPHLPPQLKELIDQLTIQTGVQGSFNVLKISWADFAVSLLDYEN